MLFLPQESPIVVKSLNPSHHRHSVRLSPIRILIARSLCFYFIQSSSMASAPMYHPQLRLHLSSSQSLSLSSCPYLFTSISSILSSCVSPRSNDSCPQSTPIVLNSPRHFRQVVLLQTWPSPTSFTSSRSSSPHKPNTCQFLCVVPAS